MSNAICKGSLALGFGCKKCARCFEELQTENERLKKRYESDPSIALAAVMRTFDLTFHSEGWFQISHRDKRVFFDFEADFNYELSADDIHREG